MAATVEVFLAICPECAAEAVLPVDGFPHTVECAQSQTVRVSRHTDTLPKTRDTKGKT